MERISEGERKARKVHQCWCCGKDIVKGETYYYQFNKDGGDAWECKSHIRCQNLINKHYDNFGDYESVEPLYEWFYWNEDKADYVCQGIDLNDEQILELKIEWVQIMQSQDVRQRGSSDET